MLSFPRCLRSALAWLTLVLPFSFTGNLTLSQEPAQPAGFAHARIPDAWQKYQHRLTFGKAQTLALVDDGCDLSLPQWSASDGDQPKVLVSYDSVDGDDNPQHEGRGYHGSTLGIPSSVNYQGQWGVAYNNQLAVIRALECCHCKLTDAATLAAGLQWVIDHHQEYRITTVNLAPVDDLAHPLPVPTPIDSKLSKLRELGIWVSAPTGNHNFTEGISWPAIQPDCFAVGAVRAGKDEVFLDRIAEVDLLVPAGATSSSNAILCGAAMLLREAIETTDYDWKQHAATLPAAMMALFQQTGVPVTDPTTQHRYRRLDLLAALDAVFATESAPTGLTFHEHLLAADYAYAYGLAVADIDHDGDLDLTSADYQPHNRLYLFENDSQGGFQQHIIHQEDPERLERHQLGDVDGDGDLDVVIVKNLRGDVIWLENPGGAVSGVAWKRQVITRDLPGAYDVILGDFDQDGDLDVAASSWRIGNQFSWFENDGNPAQRPWTKHLIEAEVAETRTIEAADFDGDGDLDLLGTGRISNEVIWYENSSQGQPSRAGGLHWKKHLIDDNAKCAAHGHPADMDGDGDLDVLMALGFYYRPGSGDSEASERRADNRVVWYENRGDPAAGNWAIHTIAVQFDDAFEAVAGDLDRDGDIDVVATSWRNPGRISWFENHGDPRESWTEHLLKTNWRSANQVLLADLNGDGWLDVVAGAEHGSNEVRWWRNAGLPPAQP